MGCMFEVLFWSVQYNWLIQRSFCFLVESVSNLSANILLFFLNILHVIFEEILIKTICGLDDLRRHRVLA